MSIDRVRYQRGTVEFHANTGKYYFRFRDADRRRRSVLLGTADELSTAAKLKRATDEMRAKVNAKLESSNSGMLMSELIVKYQKERIPERYSTRHGYLSKLKNHIDPQWGATPVVEMMTSAYVVEQWLKQHDGAPKSKVHIRGLMSVLLEYAMLLGIVPVGRNPMELVKIEGASKRVKQPKNLTFGQFVHLLTFLREPYRTMAVLAGALGLRCSEFDGLIWSDVSFDDQMLSVERAVVRGRIDDVKTRFSKQKLPLDPAVMRVLQKWKEQSQFTGEEDWVFASSAKLGRKPIHAQAAQCWALAPAGIKAGLGSVGWHDLRHSYRTWLDATGAPISVQRELMRHASITTTMDIYGRDVPESQREANKNVVGKLKNAAGAL
jgi:integrase